MSRAKGRYQLNRQTRLKSIIASAHDPLTGIFSDTPMAHSGCQSDPYNPLRYYICPRKRRVYGRTPHGWSVCRHGNYKRGELKMSITGLSQENTWCLHTCGDNRDPIWCWFSTLTTDRRISETTAEPMLCKHSKFELIYSKLGYWNDRTSNGQVYWAWY